MKKKINFFALTSFVLVGLTLSLASCDNNTQPETEDTTYSVNIINDETKGEYTLYTINDGKEEVKNDNKILGGETLKLVVNPKADYLVNNLTINGTSVAYHEEGYQFSAAKQNYSITINYTEKTYTFSINNDEECGSYTLFKIENNNETETTDLTFNKGDKFKLVVTPLEGYEVKSLTINEEEVNYVEGGYTFETTGQNYVISINYLAKTYSFSLNNYLRNNYSVEVLANDQEVTNTIELPFNTEISVEITSTYSQIAETDLNKFYIYVNGEMSHPTEENLVEGVITYTFNMSKSDTTLILAQNDGTVNKGTTNSKNLTFGELPSGIEVYGYSENDSYINSVDFTIIKTNPGFVFTGGTITDTTTGDTLLTISQYQLIFSGNIGYFNLYLNNPSYQNHDSLTINLTGEVKDVKNISYVGEDLLNINSTLPTTSIVGEQVNIYNFSPKDPTKYIEEITVTDSEGNNVSGANISDTSINFVMPNSDITITFTLADCGVVSLNGDNVNTTDFVLLNYASAYGSTQYQPDQIKPGTTFYLLAKTTDSSLLFSKATTASGEYNVQGTLEYNGSTYTYFNQFTMPLDGSNLEITLTTAQGYSISVSEENNDLATVSYGGNSLVTAGSVINVEARAINQEYKITGVRCEESDGEEIVITGSVSNNIFRGTFTMPAKNVTLTPIVEALPKYEADLLIFDNRSNKENPAFNNWSLSYGTNYVSNSTYQEGQKVTLIESNYVSFNTQLAQGVSVRFEYVNGNDETKSITPSNISQTNYNFNFQVTEEVKSIRIVFEDLNPVNVTQNISEEIDPSNLSLTYTINGVVSEETDYSKINFYPGDTVRISGSLSTPIDGKTLSITLEGNVTYQSYNQSYLISGDFSINVSLLTAYTYTLNNQVSGTSATLYDNQTYNTYSSGNSILENTSVYFIVYSYTSINFNVTIEIGDEVIYSAANVSNYHSQPFTVTDDLTITISPAENN